MKARIKQLLAERQPQVITPENKPTEPKPRQVIKCADCAWWTLGKLTLTGQPGYGRCHLFPPDAEGRLPKTGSEDWCSCGVSR